jgi:hypothetical protein
MYLCCLCAASKFAPEGQFGLQLASFLYMPLNTNRTAVIKLSELGVSECFLYNTTKAKPFIFR